MQSAAVPNSVSMEKEGLKRTLENLEDQGVNVVSLTTGGTEHISNTNMLVTTIPMALGDFASPIVQNAVI